MTKPTIDVDVIADAIRDGFRYLADSIATSLDQQTDRFMAAFTDLDAQLEELNTLVDQSFRSPNPK